MSDAKVDRCLHDLSEMPFLGTERGKFFKAAQPAEREVAADDRGCVTPRARTLSSDAAGERSPQRRLAFLRTLVCARS